MTVQDCPSIQTYLRTLNRGIDELCVKKIRIENQFFGGAADLVNGRKQSDIHTLLLCIAGETVKWQILFDAFNVDAGPDVLILNSDDFDPEYEKITSLAYWDKSNQHSLLKVIQELVGAYKNHERNKCRSLDAEIFKQIDTLSEYYEKVELSVFNNEKAGKTINVMIEIKLDIENYHEESGDGGDWTLDEPVLLIKYDLEQERRSPIIYLPPLVERMIGGRQTLTPPTFNEGQQLVHYVNHVREQMISYTNLLVESKQKRMAFIQTFLARLPGHMLEFDGTHFVKMSLLFSTCGFHYVVHVSLARTFPREQPIMTFESAYHLNRRNQLFQMTCNNYPYNPRWTASELTDHIRLLIIEKAKLFKEKSLQQGII